MGLGFRHQNYFLIFRLHKYLVRWENITLKIHPFIMFNTLNVLQEHFWKERNASRLTLPSVQLYESSLFFRIPIKKMYLFIIDLQTRRNHDVIIRLNEIIQQIIQQSFQFLILISIKIQHVLYSVFFAKKNLGMHYTFYKIFT